MQGGASCEGDTGEQVRLLDIANSVFDAWRSIIVEALQRDGVSASRAESLATLCVAAIEGTVALCRASRNVQPLDDVGAELTLAISVAVESAKMS